ncbi:hypothetical protein BBJ28_00013007 [Nothophytophthora sp. Chile5]|nr:hypothetical protein BBJ28_00013007 [Nothophytophthora sp. Chile5]
MQQTVAYLPADGSFAWLASQCNDNGEAEPEDAALRDCGLQFGFPGSATYCSKRCFEAEGLSPRDSDAEEASSTRPERGGQVPNEVTAALTVKIGDVSRTSRKQLTLTTFPFLLAEGFDVFRAKANRCTTKELQAFRGDRHVREDQAIYIKPGLHSKQAELVELSELNFESRIARSYRNFLKRKVSSGRRREPFQCEIYIYVKKDEGLKPHRRNQQRVATRSGAGVVPQQRPSGGNAAAVASAASSQVPPYGYYADHRPPQSELGGVIASSRAPRFDPNAASSATGKRKRSAAPSHVEGSGMVQQPQHFQPVIDGGYRTVRMIMNGMVVPVQVNVQDLLACFTVFQPQMAGDAASEGPHHDIEGVEETVGADGADE